MEILQEYKESGYFTSQLYHLLALKKLVDPATEITPSVYVKEMKMSTSERLQHLQNIEINNLVTEDRTKKPVLSFSPRLIVFQNFKPNDRIVAKFTVKNISNAPSFLNMVFKESTDFMIKPTSGELLSRLAPGISVTFAVTFTPTQCEDYVHRVTFYTDVDQYVVPLIALGPRPIFDFPDEIVIPPTPLKVENQVSLGIHNICDTPAGFTIATKSPFTIQPKSGYLFPNKKIELVVGFKTMHLGETVGKLTAMFETNEVFHIKLIGSTHTVSIELEKSVVRFLDTYNTMVRHQTYKITNKSNELITYMCMKNDSVYNDFEDKVKLATIFYNLKAGESEKYRKLVHYDVLSSDEHERVYTRIFYDEIQALVADETLHFQNTHFSILPIKGKLWPNKTTELTITFAPKEIGDFKAVAYLDIDGIYERVPLTMQGTSIPPSIYLHLETLDMDNVYINTKYNYEIVAVNKGHINGVIMYKEVAPLFGSIISCTPEKHCLRPGEKEIFTISFLNSNQGPYFEELNFVIPDTDVVRKLYLKGEVIYPSLTFSVPCLDFEKVSIGVPKTLQIEAINESVVNVKANVKISSDGPEISSITLEDCEASGNMQLETPQWPREFNIDPCNIELEAKSRIAIKITLTANLCRANQTCLELELDKSDSPPIILPIRYEAMVPEITPAPDIKLRACFLDFVYNYDIIISSNEFWGFASIEPPSPEETLKVDVGMKRGIIRPNTTLSLPATIMTEVLGLQEYTVRMHLFGLSQPIDICRIIANGVRPIVTCTPMSLLWGQTKLLTRTWKTLTLCNDSPVTVYFKAGLLNHDGKWTIDPVEGSIDPESETDLTLFLYLVDADTYTNKAVIQLEKVKDILVPLSATGVGTSIVVGPDRDHVNLGRHFVKIPLSYSVIMENCGTRLHSLEWLEHYKTPKTAKPPPLFFNLEPRVLKLAGGEKVELKITGMALKVNVVKEIWYLIGSVEGVNKKELLLECPLVAEFVEPKVVLSTTQIDLQYDYGPYSELYKLTDIMTIKNVSKLPLYIDVSIRPPFAIVKRAGTYKIDPLDEKMCCCICYDENDLNIQQIMNECGPQQSKVFIDCLTMKPVEPLRKGPLEFFQDIHKIKMAFNLTHAVEERLEDQEIMKLQILFDTTKHLTLKSRIYADIMKIKFKGHKNKDAVKIMGRISFPNVSILTPKVDFQCILNGSVESKTIKLQNSTNLLACYNFKWKKCNIGTIPLPEVPMIEYRVNRLSQIQADEPEHPSATTLEDVLPSPSVAPELSGKVGDASDTQDPLLVGDDGEVPEGVEVPESESIDPEEEFRQMKMKILKKITPMMEMDEDPGFSWTYKFPKMKKYKNFDLNDLFQLIPHRGMLMPNSTQFVHVIFRPSYNVNVRAVLECEVLGGPSEIITIAGKSSDLMFRLNSQVLNFKIRSFHETATEKLIITNISQLPFEYKTYMNEPVFDNDLRATIREIDPPDKVLHPEEEAHVAINIQPGVVGFFHRVFLLEIGHLPHIPIESFGWGVIPQVYLTLPRPGLESLATELGYEAISTLTIDYLEAIAEIFCNNSSEHMNTPQTEKCFEDPEFQADWHICSAWDGYPDIMDIELAIERLLAVKHIKQRPEILTLYSRISKVVPIPGFSTIPYLVDFGVVITGSKTSRSIEIKNYGPLYLKLRFGKAVVNRFGLNYKLAGKMAPGESGRLDISFAPMAYDFPELEQTFSTSITIEVPYGVTIPVQIKSLCAVPYLKCNIDKVDFGTVRCGDEKVTSVPLRNVGKPVCIWYVTLKQKLPGPCPTTMMETSGKYEPGEGGWLSISFKPIMEMAYEGTLIFKFHMNPTKLSIPVVGHSVVPHAHIIGPRVVFPPTLPWADTTEIYLGITNPCPFPIELIMAHTDEKWKEEDEMYALLDRYYNKPEEILLPAVRPGAGMPPAVQSFFNRFKTNVQRNIEEETALMNKARGATPTKRVKSPRKSLAASKHAAQEKVDKEASPRKYRTEAEIIADEIKAMKEEGLDPLKECLDGMDSSSKDKIEDKNAKGLLLFLHGSPCEEMHCKEIAYSLGMHLGIPTVNFDLCVVEALCTCECPARENLLTTINEMYEILKNKTENQNDANGEAEDGIWDQEDEFDIILKKIDTLAHTKNVGTPRSKVAEKKKKEVASATPTSTVMAAGTMFHMELIHELLTEFFNKEKFQRGFIVDSLTSIILKNPPLVLMTVLKCKDTIWNIHLVLCQSDFSKWFQAYEDAQREAELLEEQVTKVMVYDEDEIKRIVDEFEEMDEEEYENANPDLKQLYIRHGLEVRKRKYFERMGMPSDTYTNLDKPEKKSAKGKDANAGNVPSAVLATDSKKKIKKEEAKGKQSEVVVMQQNYQEYNKTVYENLINIANNWIIEYCEIGVPLLSFNGQILGAAQKKNKAKKSEVMLAMSEVNFAERGFPLTIIQCPCLRYKEAVVNMFKTCHFVQKILKVEEEFDILQCPVISKEYTVLLPKTMPVLHFEDCLEWYHLDEATIKKCECNQITDLNLLDDSTQDNVLNILSKWHCTCGKKVNSSQTSTSEIPSTSFDRMVSAEEDDAYLYPLPLHCVKAIPAPIGRLILDPGDLVRCKFTFHPKTEGNVSIKRYVEVAGWPESRVDIVASGICDLPRLDSRSKKMFQDFVRRTVEDNVYKLTYLHDQKRFEFGPIFIGRNRIYEEEYTIDLKNCSLLLADVDIGFLEETDVFQIDKRTIKLEPGCRGKLKITAAPSTIGVHNVLILFCIKDNPEIVEVNVSCCGVVPIVEILPVTKTIDYDKILLYRREDERFIVRNDSILPIMWKVRNTEDFVEDFIISQTSGIIPRNDNKVVPVTYIACRVAIISQIPLIIDIYDELGRGEPMVVDTLYLSAECYDVMVECAYENPNEGYLNYGNVKVNSTEYREMYLLNRGKYNIFYKLKKVKDFPEPSLLKSFEADPETGVVPPTLKLIAIEFQCTPTTSMNLVNVPAYTCSLLDGSKDQVVVAKFPICVTIASFYNTFTLFPLGELNFHVIAVGSGVMRDVILNNTSKCPFNYEILIPEQYRTETQAAVQMPKGKDSKLKNPPIKCGNFLIVNEDNLLAPGTSRTIPIQFLATGARRFEETIHFVVSDTCPAEAQGVPLRLVGTGAMPTIDFWNLDNTFREHLIVRNLADYKVPESSPHCVFVEDSVTFHYFCVTVNSSHKGHIDLYNNGFVPCILTTKMHYQANSSADIFSLDKNELQIEPLMHKRLGIIFSPKALKEYRAVLEVKLKLLHNQEQSFSLCIVGEGVIPRIRLLKPPLWHHRLAVLRFPVTCLGNETSKIIRFKNISTITSVVVLTIEQPDNERPVFWMRTTTKCLDMVVREKTTKKTGTYIKLSLRQEEVASVQVFFNPLVKGRTNCEVKLNIINNLYEFFTVLCEAEAFMEDVILIGLEMLSMEFDPETATTELGKVASTGSTNTDSKKKSKSAPLTKKKSKEFKKKNTLVESMAEGVKEPAVLKYLLDFGGCEICTAQKRTAIMMNNSEKVYKFIWEEKENIVIKPTVGYISPAEEKDIELMFFSIQPIVIKREPLTCTLTAISDDCLTMDLKGATWDDRQTKTVYEHNQDISVEERTEAVVEEQPVPPAEYLGLINIKILYSATTEYTKYECNLAEEMKLKDTFIYQTRSFTFKVDNVGTVPMKIMWNFYIDDEYPARIDKRTQQKELQAPPPDPSPEDGSTNRADDKSLVPETVEAESKETLVSGSIGRESVDTWFEVDLPFSIEPCKECLKPGENRTFKVIFKPLEAFEFRVCLKSSIDNLDPYDQNISCKIFAKSLIPYVHLALEESDYLTSGRRTVTSVVLPPHMEVLEFNVLGWGCYRKSFNVINPTNEGYEFVFETVPLHEYNATEFVPVHCDMMKGYVEAGTSTEVTFTFAPTAPGKMAMQSTMELTPFEDTLKPAIENNKIRVYESQWRFLISAYSLTIPLMVVGFVREPDIVFVPTILVIKNSLVDFVSTQLVMLKNNENEPLRFAYKGNSLCNELGKEPITVTPEEGTLKPLSETPIRISYNPIQDGPMSFKIFYHIEYMTQYLTLCVNALSYLVKPTVTYYIIGTEHILDHRVNTRIHLEETASTYERIILFKIKNSGSATFFYDWHYTCTPVRKYLEVYVEPRNGYLSPGAEVDCKLHFQLRQVPVYEYPVSLSISDGPEYTIQLYAEIQKPLYHFSCKEFDFGKCIVNAPDRTYKKNLAFTNDDKHTIILDLTTDNVPELYVDYKAQEPKVNPRKRLKIPVFFRPKEVKHYEFKLHFWVNSLCEDILVIRGEGVPLLVDLYEGCQKSFDLGPVKVGDRIVREIEVMNHSKVAIDASFVFKNFYDYQVDDDTASYGTSICLDPSQNVNAGPSRIKMVQEYRENLMKKQTAIDIKNVLSSVKVVPNRCIIQPHRKVTLKIHFKPIGLISLLKVQLDAVVLEQVRPLVLISGSATGMSFRFSQDSLQFGRVRKRGCKVMKVKLHNEGDYGAKFWWQPLVSEEFAVFPMQGMIAARTNVSFAITYRPLNFNPYVKLWANLNIENYKSLELALYATCVDFGAPQNKTLYLECPVRSVKTEYVVVVNPTDEQWLVISEMEGTSFETLREFHVEANSSYEIPIKFKPKTIGKHEGQVLFSPLGESALFVILIGAAVHPDPNGVYNISVPAKKSHTEYLPVYNITEKQETYAVMTELVKVVPDKFEGYYEINCPEVIKCWGEATATCRWTYICFEPCEMILKVMFVNEKTREYQFYEVNVQVTPSQIVATLKFVSRARESVQQEVKVANPLQQEAVFNIKCDKLSCAEVIKVARQSESKLQMTYSPLVVGEFEDYLTIENYIVGTYSYRVVATCLPAKEKTMEVATSFGNCIPMRLRVHNKSDQPAHFNATVDHPAINVDKEYTLPANEKGKFLVWFEPTQLGVQNIKVSFFSSIAGEFVFRIKGTATEPKPQGPFDVKAGWSTVIKFKNVFDDHRTFKITTDREDFYVKSNLEQLKAKKDMRVTVYLVEKPAGGWKDPVTGSLTIETFEPAEPKVQWTYFLQGIP